MNCGSGQKPRFVVSEGVSTFGTSSVCSCVGWTRNKLRGLDWSVCAPLFQSTLLQKRQTALCSKCLCLDPTFVDSGADRLLFPSAVLTLPVSLFLEFTPETYLRRETPGWAAEGQIETYLLGPSHQLLSLRNVVCIGPLYIF